MVAVVCHCLGANTSCSIRSQCFVRLFGDQNQGHHKQMDIGGGGGGYKSRNLGDLSLHFSSLSVLLCLMQIGSIGGLENIAYLQAHNSKTGIEPFN